MYFNLCVCVFIQLTVENMDYQKTLEASQDSQKYLTREVREITFTFHDLFEKKIKGK